MSQIGMTLYMLGFATMFAVLAGAFSWKAGAAKAAASEGTLDTATETATLHVHGEWLSLAQLYTLMAVASVGGAVIAWLAPALRMMIAGLG